MAKQSKSFAQIQAEIKALQSHAEEARKREIGEVVAKIKEAISTYDLTAADLGFRGVSGATRGSARGQTSGTGRPKGVPKYQDPKTGRTWTGQGKPPNWIAGAKDRTPFLIDATGRSATKADQPTTRQALSKVAKSAAGRKPGPKPGSKRGALRTAAKAMKNAGGKRASKNAAAAPASAADEAQQATAAS